MHKNVLITGGSGLLGTRLSTMLMQKDYQVSHLSRSSSHGRIPTYRWSVNDGMLDRHAIEGVESIVHLAGAGIADKRWTATRKKEILESRTKSSELLYQTLKQNTHHVKTFVSASAIGIYGEGGPEKIFTETDKPADGFLADVVKQWEESVDKIATLGIRVVKIRIGILLSGKGGALAEMVKPIKWGVGSPLGSGKQILSWVHIDDVCRMFIKAIEDEMMIGAYNAVANNPVSNEELTMAIAKVLDRPLWAPNVPGFILKFMLGEMSELVLKGNQVSSEKIRNLGFEFEYTHLDNAVNDLLTSKGKS
ncbi:MAG: TIGR01777 family oxidoreductase [Cyclobacteriaceae bacterium]|nr:TIGR01777 family oxidoreductase [Cyclobacteriaceae bacterium]